MCIQCPVNEMSCSIEEDVLLESVGRPRNVRFPKYQPRCDYNDFAINFMILTHQIVCANLASFEAESTLFEAILTTYEASMIKPGRMASVRLKNLFISIMASTQFVTQFFPTSCSVLLQNRSCFVRGVPCPMKSCT